MTKRPHILLLSSWYPSDAHPFLGNFVERQARLLLTQYDVTVLITESRSDSAFEVLDTTIEGLREIRVHYQRSTKLLERRRGMEQALQAGLERIQRVNLVIGHVALQKGLQFVQAKKHFSCPLILVEHASYYRPEMRAKRSWIEALVLRKTRKHCDAVVAVSDFLKKDMQSDFPKHSIQIIGNPVDDKLFFPKEKAPGAICEFLHVSTLDERTKNPEGILCAFRCLKESISDFRLTIVSDEDSSQWQELARHFELQDHVRFVGPLAWNELTAYYHAADAFVLFSHYESFSIVLAEAWLTGTPTITTPVGIAAELPDFLGKTVPVNDVKALCTSLLDFAQNRPDYSQSAIVNYAAQYSNDAVLEQWKTLITRTIG